MALAEMRADIEAGASVDAVIERHRVFFKEKAATSRAQRRWTAAALDNAIDRARRAERGLMSGDSAGTVLADDAFVTIARIAARAR
jgi:DNA polymerase-3 subunit delta